MTVEKQTCPVCNREIDARGMSGHMRTHKKQDKGAGDDGVISYPSNEQKNNNIQDDSGIAEIPDPTRKIETKPVKKQVKKPVAGNPASNATSKPEGNDSRGTRKTETEMKKEYKGLFR